MPIPAVEQALTNKRKRSKIADPSSWDRNRKKLCRESGKEYKTSSGKVAPARKAQEVDCSKCRRNCTNLISVESQIQINSEFWAIANKRLQSQFLINLVVNTKKSSTQTDKKSRRTCSWKYFLPYKSDKVRVCKNFFLSTLDISEARIRTIIKEGSPSLVAPADRRGRHRANQRPEETRDIIRKHIKSFKALPSHYCRQSTKYQYLASDLNMKIMYEMYTEHCLLNDSEFNLKFHKPRKDWCDKCFIFKNANPERQLQLQEEHNIHLAKKMAARKF